MNNELTAALLTIEKCRELSGCPAGVDLQDWVKQLAEPRTVTVKLVDINEFLADVHDKTLALAFRRLAEGVREADISALTAQGIKWEAE